MSHYGSNLVIHNKFKDSGEKSVTSSGLVLISAASRLKNGKYIKSYTFSDRHTLIIAFPLQAWAKLCQYPTLISEKHSFAIGVFLLNKK